MEETVDPDVVADHVVLARESAVKGHSGVEQPVHGQAPGMKVDAQISTKQEVGLARFDGHARHDPAGVNVPVARSDVVLGDDPARAHRKRLTLDRENPIHQHQRLIGQANPHRERVYRQKFASQDAC